MYRPEPSDARANWPAIHCHAKPAQYALVTQVRLWLRVYRQAGHQVPWRQRQGGGANCSRQYVDAQGLAAPHRADRYDRRYPANQIAWLQKFGDDAHRRPGRKKTVDRISIRPAIMP